MFFNRRRVPSEGALRVLRQLAYISSGTACGAAAVIAEERRRQITLVSKIADNSHRLKQHPRYQHSHAAQRRPGDDLTRLDATPAATTTAATTTTHSDSRTPLDASDSVPPQADAFRNNLLPSEVERGYAKLDSRRSNHHKSQIQHPHTRKESRPSVPKFRRQYALQSPPPPPAIDLPLFSASVKQHGVPKALAQLEAHCQHLVSKNQTRDAFGLFYRCFDRVDLFRKCPQDSTAAAVRLFDAFLNTKSYSRCREMLKWMEFRGCSIVSCLNGFAHSCATYTYPRWLIWLYDTYGDKVLFPEHTYPAFCAAYATHNTQVSALLFAKHISPSDRHSVLPTCEPAWPAILEHMWNQTNNWSLVDAIFRDMCQLVQEPPLELYNAIIHVCIKSGRVGRAHKHLHTIQQSNYLHPDVTTFGHFVLLTASSSDWPSLDDLMAMLTRAGKDEAPFEKRTELFIPVFSAYAKNHSPEELWTFLFKAIDEYGVLPDLRFSEVALPIFVRACRFDLIPAWINNMKTRGLEAEIPPETALNMLRQYYFELRPSHAVLMFLCRRLVRHVPEYSSEGVLALLREAIVYDIRGYRPSLTQRMTRAMLVLNKLEDVDITSQSLPKPAYPHQLRQVTYNIQTTIPPPNSGAPDKTAESSNLKGEEHFETETTNDPSSEDIELLDDLPDMALSRDALARLKTDNEMLVCLSTGRYNEAMKLYRKNLGQSGLPNSSYSLEVAMQAQIKASPEGLHDSHGLVRSAEEGGLEATTALIPLLNKHIQDAAVDSPIHIDNIRQTVFTLYKRMVKHRVPIKHHLATAAASVLARHNKIGDSIRLLSDIYHSPWTGRVPLDMPAMTVFLQAYIKTSHRAGIQWVIEEVLTKNYRIDYAFLTVIHKARKHSKERSLLGGPKGMNHLRLSRMLEQYSQVCSARQREQIKRASVLGNKLVRTLIKVARPKEDVEDPLKQEFLDAHPWEPNLRDKSGRRIGYRMIGSRKRHELLRSRRLDQHARRRGTRVRVGKDRPIDP